MRLPATLLLLLLACWASAQTVSLGGGPIAAAELGTAGLNLRGYYNIGSKVCFGPEVSAMLPRTTGEAGHEDTEQLTEVNLNVHYIFEWSHSVGVYPVTGVNFTNLQQEISDPMLDAPIERTEQAFGLNLGAGVHLEGHSLIPYAEYKYVVGNLPDHFLTVGLLFTLGKRENQPEHEAH